MLFNLYNNDSLSISIIIYLISILLKGMLKIFRKMQFNHLIKFSYHENVIDHYENPRNVGAFGKIFILDKKRRNVGTGLVGAPACGDVMKL